MFANLEDVQISRNATFGSQPILKYLTGLPIFELMFIVLNFLMIHSYVTRKTQLNANHQPGEDTVNSSQICRIFAGTPGTAQALFVEVVVPRDRESGGYGDLSPVLKCMKMGYLASAGPNESYRVISGTRTLKTQLIESKSPNRISRPFQFQHLTLPTRQIRLLRSKVGASM
jgi:hypothetical protein